MSQKSCAADGLRDTAVAPAGMPVAAWNDLGHGLLSGWVRNGPKSRTSDRCTPDRERLRER